MLEKKEVLERLEKIPAEKLIIPRLMRHLTTISWVGVEKIWWRWSYTVLPPPLQERMAEAFFRQLWTGVSVPPETRAAPEVDLEGERDRGMETTREENPEPDSTSSQSGEEDYELEPIFADHVEEDVFRRFLERLDRELELYHVD